MAVLVSCSLPQDDFALGSALGGDAPTLMAVDLIERDDAVPLVYAWVAADVVDRVEASLADSVHVDAFERVDRVADCALYRVDWQFECGDVLDGVVESDATLLDATTGDRWTLWLRFADHDRLAQFYNRCTDDDVDLTLDWVVTLPPDGDRPGLTPEQRETLVLALREGYFSVPSEVSTSELADDIGVSQQAISQRIRRGTERVLRATLLDERST